MQSSRFGRTNANQRGENLSNSQFEEIQKIISHNTLAWTKSKNAFMLSLLFYKRIKKSKALDVTIHQWESSDLFLPE